MPTHAIDAAIIGGGIAGAWALYLLRRRGYNAVLLERESIGCGQTLASQGMIHGGLKYALGGNLTGASEAIAQMPARWRACLAGEDEVNLLGTPVLSDVYHRCSARSAIGRLTSFFASKALRGRIDKLAKSEWPAAFDGFDGVVYTLNDFVMDTPALLTSLTREHADYIFSLNADCQNVQACDGGWRIQLSDIALEAKQLISCAGNGSENLIKGLGVPNIEVQYRPLKQVIVRPGHEATMFAHCLTGIHSNEPRLTITTHKGTNGIIWYLGGQIASSGFDLNDNEQIEHARSELTACVPWLSWQDAEFDVLTIDRAEPKQASGHRPDEAYVAREGSFIQCFPTKLTLTPDLGDKLLDVLDPPRGGPPPSSTHTRAEIGREPW